MYFFATLGNTTYDVAFSPVILKRGQRTPILGPQTQTITRGETDRKRSDFRDNLSFTSYIIASLLDFSALSVFSRYCDAVILHMRYSVLHESAQAWSSICGRVWAFHSPAIAWSVCREHLNPADVKTLLTFELVRWHLTICVLNHVMTLSPQPLLFVFAFLNVFCY